MIGRRKILKSTGLGIAASIAGCLGIGGGSGGNGNSVKPADITEFPVSDVESSLNLWDMYDSFATYAAQAMPEDYEGLNSISNTGYSSVSGPYSKVQSGNHSIDNVCSSTEYTALFMENDLIEPLPVENMPNWEKMDDQAIETMEDWAADDDGNIYSVPHTTGLWPALGYNSEALGGEPDSWDILWDSEYEGKLTMQDQPLVSGFIAASYTGQDFTNPDDFADIKEALLQQKPLINTYWTDYSAAQRMFVSESVVAGPHTMGRLYQAHFDSDAKYVNYTIPDEGALRFFDSLVIPKEAPNPRASTAFLNWSLEPEHAVKQFTEGGYLPPVDVSEEMSAAGVSQDQIDFVTWSDSERERIIPWEPLDTEVRDRYNEIWTEVKAQ